VKVAQKGELLCGGPKDSDRLPKGDREKISTMENTDCGSNWIQNDILCTLKLSDAEISGTLVESKSDMHRLDVTLKVLSMQL
jgi:hypothetical protein